MYLSRIGHFSLPELSMELFLSALASDRLYRGSRSEGAGVVNRMYGGVRDRKAKELKKVGFLVTIRVWICKLCWRRRRDETKMDDEGMR